MSWPVTERMVPGQWKPEGDPRELHGPVGEAEIQYLRGPGGVGAHAVYLSTGETIVLLPDSSSTIRKRTGAVSVALGGNSSVLATVIGELVLAGARNMLIDGEPLFIDGGRWVDELADAGEVTMRYVGGKG